MKSLLLYLSFLPTAAALAAQELAPAAKPAVDIRLGDTPFLTPIRTVAADNGRGGGRWASGSNYKVALDDGVTFYPVLGEDAPKNLPLRWRTREIVVAGQSVLGPLAAAQPHASDWRYELRHGAVTEAYDVRNDGVEQTFVLHSRPTANGDLVITGDIASELCAPPSPWQHKELSFNDKDGNERVRYGAATAIDARGASVPMETRYDGSAISLRLCGEWLATAQFPVVVDPLLASTTLASHASAMNDLDIARDDGFDDLMIVYRRASAAGDYDGFGFKVRDDFLMAGITVFADLDAAWSTRHLSVAFVGGTNKWIIALERSVMGATTAVSNLRFRLHDSGDPIPDNTVEYIYNPLGTSWVSPDVGGSLASGAGNQALIVFRAEYPFNTPYNSDVFGILVNTATGLEGSPFSLAGDLVGNTYDRGSMRVNKESGGVNASWVVAYTEINRSVVNDDIDILLTRVAPNGSVTGSFAVASTSPDHKVTPVVDGRDGRYMLVYGLRAFGHGNPWTHTVVSRRFDFGEAANAPSFRGGNVTLASGGEFYTTDISFDVRTRSHWVATYYASDWSVVAKRMGYDAFVAETATLYNSPGSGSFPTVVFNDDARHFHIAYAVLEGETHRVRARTMVYPDTAATLEASGCGGTISATDFPYAGHEFFAVEASGLMVGAPAILLAGAARANIPLDFLSMPGCNLLIAPETLLFTIGTTVSAAQVARVDMPLPTPVRGLDVYFQWAHFWFGANPAHLLATRRLSVPVR